MLEETKTIREIERLAVIACPTSQGMEIKVLAAVRKEGETNFFETTLGVSDLGDDHLDAIFEISKQTIKELLDGKVTLSEQAKG